MSTNRELDTLASFSAVAKNRAFFETLSASQLTARQSRGPFVYKKVSHTCALPRSRSLGTLAHLLQSSLWRTLAPV